MNLVIDDDPVTIDFRHFGFPRNFIVKFVVGFSLARSIGNWEMRKQSGGLAVEVLLTSGPQNLAATHKAPLKNLFSSVNSKLHFLPTGTVSLFAPSGIDPVG